MSRLAELVAQIAKMIYEMLLGISSRRLGRSGSGAIIMPAPAAAGNSFIEDSNKLIDIEKNNKVGHKKAPLSNEIIKLERYDNDSNRASFTHQYAQTQKNRRHLLPGRTEIEQRSGSPDFAKWITDLDDNELSRIASSKFYRVQDHIKNKMMINDVPQIGESKSAHEKLLEEAEKTKLRIKSKSKKSTDPDDEYSASASPSR